MKFLYVVSAVQSVCAILVLVSRITDCARSGAQKQPYVTPPADDYGFVCSVFFAPLEKYRKGVNLIENKNPITIKESNS